MPTLHSFWDIKYSTAEQTKSDMWSGTIYYMHLIRRSTCIYFLDFNLMKKLFFFTEIIISLLQDEGLSWMIPLRSYKFDSDFVVSSSSVFSYFSRSKIEILLVHLSSHLLTRCPDQFHFSFFILQIRYVTLAFLIYVFRFLSIRMNSNKHLSIMEEISNIIELAWRAIRRNNTIFKSSTQFCLKRNVFDQCILPVLTYIMSQTVQNSK